MKHPDIQEYRRTIVFLYNYHTITFIDILQIPFNLNTYSQKMTQKGYSNDKSSPIIE